MKNIILNCCLAVLFGAAAIARAAMSGHDSVELVKNYTTDAVIVIADNADESLKTTVDDFQQHIYLMTKTVIPIVTYSKLKANDKRYRIIFGKAALPLLKHLPSEKEVGFDGFRILVSPVGMAIAGWNTQGTRNGIYWFLEKKCGTYWFYPGEYGTSIPNVAHLSVPLMDIKIKPDFKFRRLWYNRHARDQWTNQELQAYYLWRIRNRAGGVKGYVGHYWKYVIPKEKYFKTHPEYFSFYQGKRRPLQLCLANKAVEDIYYEKIAARFRADPSYQFFSVTPNDGSGWCECEACQSLGPDISTRNVVFFNRLAKRLEKEFPHRQLAFYAYHDTVKPPAVDCHPNVIPWVTHYSIDQVHSLADKQSSQQAKFRKIITDWQTRASGIGVREYASWWPTPCVEAARIAADNKYYYSVGVRVMNREYIANQYGTHLLWWLEQQLLWDHTSDYQQLMKIFFRRFYGKGGAKMQQAYNCLAAQLANVPLNKTFTGENISEAPQIFTIAALDAALQKMHSALVATHETLFRQRIKREIESLMISRQFLVVWQKKTALFKNLTSASRKQLLTELQKLRRLLQNRSDHFIASNGRMAKRWMNNLLISLEEGSRVYSGTDYHRLYDNLNAGGRSLLEAEKIVNLIPGTYGLYLPAKTSGYIQYRFDTAAGWQFDKVGFKGLHFYPPKNGTAQITVQRDSGKWQTFSVNRKYNKWSDYFSLDKFVKGAKSFRIRLEGNNQADKQSLLLDAFVIEIYCQPKTN